MLENISLCVIKIEIDLETSEGKKSRTKTRKSNRKWNIKDTYRITIFHITEQEGAVSSEHPTNPRVQKERERDRGLRQARDIIIETHTNQRWTEDLSSGGVGEEKETHKMNWAAALQQHTNSPTAGSSRETTPRSSDESQGPPAASNFPQEIGYFSGNPIVEVTKGIIHLYKKKLV